MNVSHNNLDKQYLEITDTTFYSFTLTDDLYARFCILCLKFMILCLKFMILYLEFVF